MLVTQTPRLILRRLTDGDAPFILALLNEPGFLQFIGDKGVRDIAGAINYMRTGPMQSYQRFGFGLWLVVRQDDAQPLGICGLLQRDTLPSPDLGYALANRFEGMGYMKEAASATLKWARENTELTRVLALTMSDNDRSMGLLQTLGFSFLEKVQMYPDSPPDNLYQITL